MMSMPSDPAPKKRGRPPLADELETVPVTIRLTSAQREKLRLLGGAQWIRDMIDNLKMTAASRESLEALNKIIRAKRPKE